MVKFKDLTNHFLIAMPSINDPIFKKSLILICEDNTEGTMGIIINKPIDDTLIADMLLQNDLKDNYPIDSTVYFGGPVNLNVGFVLHGTNYQTERTLNISKDISLTSDNKIITDIKKNNGPNNFKFTLGYAGWDKKQLSNEIKNGDWIVTPAESKYILQKNNDNQWDMYSSLIGINQYDLGSGTGTA